MHKLSYLLTVMITRNYTCANTISEFLPFSMFNQCHRYTSVKTTVFITVLSGSGGILLILVNTTPKTHQMQGSWLPNSSLKVTMALSGLVSEMGIRDRRLHGHNIADSQRVTTNNSRSVTLTLNSTQAELLPTLSQIPWQRVTSGICQLWQSLSDIIQLPDPKNPVLGARIPQTSLLPSELQPVFISNFVAMATWVIRRGHSTDAIKLVDPEHYSTEQKLRLYQQKDYDSCNSIPISVRSLAHNSNLQSPQLSLGAP